MPHVCRPRHPAQGRIERHGRRWRGRRRIRIGQLQCQYAVQLEIFQRAARGHPHPCHPRLRPPPDRQRTRLEPRTRPRPLRARRGGRHRPPGPPQGQNRQFRQRPRHRLRQRPARARWRRLLRRLRRHLHGGHPRLPKRLVLRLRARLADGPDPRPRLLLRPPVRNRLEHRHLHLHPPRIPYDRRPQHRLQGLRLVRRRLRRRHLQFHLQSRGQRLQRLGPFAHRW